MHPILFALPLSGHPFPVLPALLAAALLGAALAVYGHVLRRTGLRTFGVALTSIGAASGWVFRKDTLSLGPFEIPAYGTALGLAIVVGWWLTLRSASRKPDLAAAAPDTLIVCAVCGLLAGRASFVLISADRLPELEVLAFRQGGLLGMGALLGGLLASYAFLRHLDVDFWAWLDAIAPAFALGVVLVRVGCYFEGCDYGTLLHDGAPDWLLALGRFERWPSPSEGLIQGPAAFIDQVVSGTLPASKRFAHPVHPVQLYEALGALLLLVLAHWLARRHLPKGQLGLSVVFGYALLRFTVEAWRGDVGRGLLGPSLRPTVLLGIGLMLFAAAFAYGPANSFRRGRARLLALALSVVPAALLALLVSRSTTPLRPSISHWLALGIAAWAAHAWTRTERRTSAARA